MVRILSAAAALRRGSPRAVASSASIDIGTPRWRRVVASAACAIAALTSILEARAADVIEAVTVALPVVVPSEFTGDLRHVPRLPAVPREERPYRPLLKPPGQVKTPTSDVFGFEKQVEAPAITEAAPAPSASFEGIARLDSCTGGQCGNGTPPDTNGEVGPNHYIQAVNSAYAIYDKSGTRLAAFTENQLWAGDSTLCATDSFGDPIVLYDALADRWILTHFAFQFSGNIAIQPFFQCIAVSKTADPVAGGWWRYPVRVDDDAHPWLNDYGKFGIWSDCLYMSANEFTGAGAFAGTLFASFSRADMYAGLPLTSSIGFIVNTTDPFTMLPSHLSGQAGANLPANTPNYYVSESQTLFAFEVRKFTAGPNCGPGGTMTAPVNVSQTSYNLWNDPFVAQPDTTIDLDAVGDRLMQKAQYRNVGGVESLWVAHTFKNGAGATAKLGVQWAQINVTGGTISTTPAQQQKYAPDSTLSRFMPSIAVDGQGNMAIGYTTSGSTAPNYPSIAYSGRLASDTASTLPQTETFLIQGGGSQTGNCGGAPCDRWGDYSSMSVDPADDCTFWLTNEYYPGPPDPSTVAWHTRIGAFRFPSCTASTRKADLAITNSDGLATVAPGSAITYTIVVTNNGPFAVSGATVVDNVPASITNVTWTCAASAGNSCPASGSGSINTSAVSLMKGGTATFSVHGTVSASASGTLSNTATVNVPAGFTDPVGANNSATDTTSTGVSLAPPNIAKIFSPTSIVVGQTSTLTITVTNPNALVPLTGIGFSDPLPAGVGAGNASTAGCGGTVTVSANVVTLANGTLAGGGNCSIAITVTGAQAQGAAWTNTIASVTSAEGGANAAPASATITVGTAATSTTIVSDLPDPTVVGQAYTVTYGVVATAPGSGTPGGTVTVSDGAAQCTGTLPATSCQLTSTSSGAKSLSATYNGSTNFAASASTSVAHQVNPAATTTAIVSDVPDPTTIGQPYTVTYAVAVTAPGAGTPGGIVTVSDGAAQCVGTLPATSCQLTSTSAGAKSLTATYGGNANFTGSVSSAAAHQTDRIASTTTITSDGPDPTVVGQPYTVNYTVTGNGGTPTGTVTVSDGSAQCIGTLPATSCQLTSTSGGAKSLTATYGGDPTFAGSASATAPHQVGKAATTTAIVSDAPDPTAIGQPYTVTYSVTVGAPGAGVPSGTVTVNDGTDECIGTLPATSCDLTSTTPGVKSLAATYVGDASFAGSVSATSAHLVTGSSHQLTVTRSGSGAGTVTSEDLAIDCGATCAQPFADGTTVVLTATAEPGSVFTGWLGACTGAATCSVIIAATTTVSATFAPDTIGTHTLDLDGNGAYDALTDGLLALRDLFGLSGASLVSGAVGTGAQRATAAAIGQYVTDVLPRLDVDGNGQADALTDGLLVIRYLFGLRGGPLVAGAVGTGATRTTAAAIETYLQSLTP